MPRDAEFPFSNVRVHLLGGDLEVEYAERLFLKGPAEKVFEGTLF